MDAVGPRRLCGGDDLVDAQVAFARRARTNVDNLIGRRHERGGAIGLGADGDATHP
jgi:hypothetical protein